MNNSENIMREYQQAFSDHDIQKVRQLLHPQYSHTGSDGQRREGIEAGIEIASMYMNAFPDLNIDIKTVYSMGDVVVSEFIAQGTQKGKIMDINPTNRRVNIPVCDIIEVRDGKIYSEREYYDVANMMQQLGVQSGQTAQA